MNHLLSDVLNGIYIALILGSILLIVQWMTVRGYLHKASKGTRELLAGTALMMVVFAVEQSYYFTGRLLGPDFYVNFSLTVEHVLIIKTAYLAAILTKLHGILRIKSGD